MSDMKEPGLHEPSPAAAAVIARYESASQHVHKGIKTARSQRTYLARMRAMQRERTYLARMRAMQRELIQAYLPDMGLEDALRASRTIDWLDRQDEAALAEGAA